MLFTNNTLCTIRIKKKTVDGGKQIDLTEEEIAIPTVKELINNKALVSAETKTLKVEAPKVEAPKVEAPKVEQPKAKFEKPSKQEPKVETKIEEAKEEIKA